MAAITIQDIPQINIDKLRKSLYLTEGKKESGTYQANDNDPVLNLESDLTSENRVLKIKYPKINTNDFIDNEIEILAVPSNLGNGKGVNLYFICPVSGRKAKILYYDLKSHLFVQRKSYFQNLYYPMDTYGKVERIFANIEFHEEKLIKCFLELKEQTNNGKLPATFLKIKKLQNRKQLLEFLHVNFLTKKFNSWEQRMSDKV